MVDVVVNDMGLAGTDANVDYAAYNPFNDPKFFHTQCNIDYQNQTSVEDVSSAIACIGGISLT